MDIGHGVPFTLFDELPGLELRANEPLVAVDLAQGDHVLCCQSPGGPMGVDSVLCDAGWLGIETRHSMAIQRVECVSIAFEECSDFAGHGVLH